MIGLIWFLLAIAFAGLGIAIAQQSKTSPDAGGTRKMRRAAILFYVAAGLAILAGLGQLIRS